MSLSACMCRSLIRIRIVIFVMLIDFDGKATDETTSMVTFPMASAIECLSSGSCRNRRS